MIHLIGAGEFGREVSGWIESGFTNYDNYTLCDSKHFDFSNNKNYIFTIGSSKARLDLYKEFKIDSLSQLMIGTQKVSSNVNLKNNIILMNNVSIATNTIIGYGTHVHGNSVIGHDVIVEDFVTVGANVFLGGNVIVREGTTIHPGSSIMPGVEIGKNVTIGIGSVVIRNIPDNVTVIGNPAKRIF